LCAWKSASSCRVVGGEVQTGKAGSCPLSATAQQLPTGRTSRCTVDWGLPTGSSCPLAPVVLRKTSSCRVVGGGLQTGSNCPLAGPAAVGWWVGGYKQAATVHRQRQQLQIGTAAVHRQQLSTSRTSSCRVVGGELQTGSSCPQAETAAANGQSRTSTCGVVGRELQTGSSCPQAETTAANWHSGCPQAEPAAVGWWVGSYKQARLAAVNSQRQQLSSSRTSSCRGGGLDTAAAHDM